MILITGDDRGLRNSTAIVRVIRSDLDTAATRMVVLVDRFDALASITRSVTEELRSFSVKAHEFRDAIRSMRAENLRRSLEAIRFLSRQVAVMAWRIAPNRFFPTRRARGAVPAKQSTYQGEF